MMKRVIAKLQLVETAPEIIKNFTEDLIKKSRAENGNISYDLYQNVLDSSVFLFIEVYRNKEAVDIHFNSEHLTGFLDRIKTLLREEPEVLIDEVDERNMSDGANNSYNAITG